MDPAPHRGRDDLHLIGDLPDRQELVRLNTLIRVPYSADYYFYVSINQI